MEVEVVHGKSEYYSASRSRCRCSNLKVLLGISVVARIKRPGRVPAIPGALLGVDRPFTFHCNQARPRYSRVQSTASVMRAFLDDANLVRLYINCTVLLFMCSIKTFAMLCSHLAVFSPI